MIFPTHGAAATFDMGLAALAVVVGVLCAALAVRFYMRIWSEPVDRRRWWLLLTGVATGATVWELHMLARLAVAPEIPQVYDPAIVLMALLVGSLACTGAVWISVLPLGKWAGYLIGALIGFVSASVHFAGAIATHAAGEVHWHPDLVVVTYVWTMVVSGIATSRMVYGNRNRAGLEAVVVFGVSMIVQVPLSLLSVDVIPGEGGQPPPGMTEAGALSMVVIAVAAMMLVLGAAIFAIDQSATRDARARYRHLALHDTLTGLPNRAHLRESLEEAIAASGALGARLALVCIDLNRFKPVNDVHGHAAGDALLRGIAAALRDTLGPGEFLARTGGDEFVAFKTAIARREDALAFAARLRAAIARPVEWEGLALAVDCAAGIAFLPDDAQESEALFNRADLALYRAKDDPQDPVRFYEGRMDEASRARSALAMELRDALREDRFELHFQPQADLGSGGVTGFEALVRWRHPSRGLVAPDEFIPVAEATGLIRDLGAWVLQEACRIAAGWPENCRGGARGGYRVSVNVSPLQLAQPDYVETVQDALLVSGLAPELLELEVTEASLVADHERLLEVMQGLKRLGVRVAMDDYGAGLASMQALRSFPFDRLKIDRAFVDGMLSDPQALAMVEATLLQARALGIPVLAEGVSEETHLATLRRFGCGEAQGYLFGRPMQAADAAKLIMREETRLAAAAAGAAAGAYRSDSGATV